MSKINTFNTPVDTSKETMGNYYVNLYKNDLFVEGRHYEWFSGNSMMDEVRHLKSIGYTVEW
jgi:hypothetical protein